MNPSKTCENVFKRRMKFIPLSTHLRGRNRHGGKRSRGIDVIEFYRKKRKSSTGLNRFRFLKCVAESSPKTLSEKPIKTCSYYFILFEEKLNVWKIVASWDLSNEKSILRKSNQWRGVQRVFPMRHIFEEKKKTVLTCIISIDTEVYEASCRRCKLQHVTEITKTFLKIILCRICNASNYEKTIIFYVLL